MTSSLRSKKLLIPMAALAAVITTLVIMSPSAIAQISNSTNPGNNTSPEITSQSQIKGTINLANVIVSQVKVSFSDAAKTAQDQVSGGMVVGGRLAPMQGYLVYIFNVVDPSTKTAYLVVIDPGNGQVLFKSQGHDVGSIFGQGQGAEHAKGMMHRFQGKMMQSPPQTSQKGLPNGVPPEVMSGY